MKAQAHSITSTELEELLRIAATDEPTTAQMFVYDELPFMKAYPAEWEDVLIRASQWNLASDSLEVKDACVRTLIRMRSGWGGIPDRLVELVKACPSLDMYYTVHDYARMVDWRVPGDLAREVLASLDRRPRLCKAVLRIDGKVRDLWKHCRVLA